MNIVLDVSASIPVLIDQEQQERFTEVLSQAEVVIAPEIFIPELGNAVWKYVNYTDLSQEKGAKLLSLGLEMVDHFFSQSEIIQSSFKMAVENNITVYDSMYLALCKNTGFKLLSNDKVLNGVGEKMGLIYE